MRRNLFTRPEYTMDTSALFEVMDPERKYEKSIFKRLWDDICILCDKGKIVSHIEVYKEIRDGGIKEKILWAKKYKFIFQNYELPAEGDFIKQIGSNGGDFIRFLEQGKQKSIHADPWLVAQAKINNLILITEENPAKSSIPWVCNHFGVKSINLLGLMKEEGWTY